MATNSARRRILTFPRDDTFVLERPESTSWKDMWRGLRAWTNTHRDFLLLLVLFFTFRLMSLVFTSQEGYLSDSKAHDYWFYRDFAELTLRGYYPFVDYWLEYPPVFAWAIIGIYKVSLLMPAFRDSLFPFYLLLGGFLLLAETGSFALIYMIATKLYGQSGGMRVAFMYAGLFLPAYVLVGWFDSVPLFFMLLSLYLLIVDRPMLSGAVTGLGFMTKIIPGILLCVALRSLTRWSDHVRYAIASAVVVGLIALPFAILNASMLVASFRAALVRSSWETIWAVIEGYYEFGRVAPLSERFWPESAAWQSHPATLPWLWITLAFGAGYVAIYALRLNWRGPKAMVASAALSLSFLFVASKGYSPQFVVYILPFVFLLMPSGWGLLFALLYSIVNLLEYPVYALVFPDETWILWLTTSVRTAMFILLGLEAASQLSPRFDSMLDRLKHMSLRPAAIGLVLLLVVSGGVLAQRFFERSEFFLLSQFIGPISLQGQGVVVSSRELFYYVHPYLRQSDFYVIEDDWASRQNEVVDELQQFARGRPQLWLVLDRDRRDDGRVGFVEQLLQGQGTKSTNRYFDRFRLVGFVLPSSAVPDVKTGGDLGTNFSGVLRLESYQISADNVLPGQPVRVILRWRALHSMSRDYTVFVHLRNDAYKIWGQQDKPLTNLAVPTSQWKVGDVVEDVYDLLVLPGTPPGDYKLTVGMYTPKVVQRLQVVDGPSDGPDKVTFEDILVRRGPWVGQLTFQHQRIANLDNKLRLLGYETDRLISPGNVAPVTLFWRAAQNVEEDYVVSLQLLDRERQVFATAESQPADGMYPTSRWSKGDVVRDQYHLLVSKDAVPGDYQIVFRVTRKDNGDELPLVSEPAPSDGWISLGWVRVPTKAELQISP